MPTPTKGSRLGGGPAHEKQILANLAASLFEHRSITTTVTKAKRLRPYAERLITKAKQGDLASRRQVVSKISANNATNQEIVHELFTVIAPAMAEREGGYTRITKIGNRKGDNAPMAVVELVMEPVSPKQQVVADAEGAAQAAADQAPAEDAEAAEEAEAEEAEAGEAEAAEQETTEEEPTEQETAEQEDSEEK